MPSFNIVRKSCPKDSFRVQSIIGTYDLQTKNIEEHFEGEINLPEIWNVGLIVGRSGSGKSTIANELFGDYIVDKFDYHEDCILDDMPKEASVKDISATLTAVGFSSAPSWLKSYNVLSNGEKMRCDIARAMLENRELFVFDEFTSVVDRNVAKVSSFAIQKAIRRKNKKFVAVTCHYDVEEWLMPDWVFNTDTMEFRTIDAETQKKNKPKLRIDIYQTKEKEYYWRMFRKYHYLSHNFNKAADVYLCVVNGQLCGFCAALPFPHPKRKNTYKEHRTIIFPDYQGVGIGTAFSDFVAEHYKQKGKSFISTTTNPSMIHSRANNPKWRTTHIGRFSTNTGVLRKSVSKNRLTVSFEFVGDNK